MVPRLHKKFLAPGSASPAFDTGVAESARAVCSLGQANSAGRGGGGLELRSIQFVQPNRTKVMAWGPSTHLNGRSQQRLNTTP